MTHFPQPGSVRHSTTIFNFHDNRHVMTHQNGRVHAMKKILRKFLIFNNTVKVGQFMVSAKAPCLIEISRNIGNQFPTLPDARKLKNVDPNFLHFLAMPAGFLN